MKNRTERSRLLLLLRRQAVLRGKFVLSSGQESSYYVDARRVTLSAEGCRLVGRVIWNMVEADALDAVAGLTLGADPVVTAVSLTSSDSGHPMDGLIVRKAAKEHGTGKRVEGPLRPGTTALVVEDTATTGASALEAASALGSEGVTVNRVITLIDREEGARESVEGAGIRFDAVFTVSEVLDGGGEAEGSRQLEVSDVPAAGTDARAISDHESMESGGATTRVKRLLLHADGSAVGNPGPAGAGFALFDVSFKEVRRGSVPLGRATNNVAEYMALIRGMEAALAEGAHELTVRMDSSLVMNQMNGVWKVKHPDMQGLHAQARDIARRFRTVRFEFVRREQNRLADRLATDASSRSSTLPTVTVSKLVP